MSIARVAFPISSAPAERYVTLEINGVSNFQIRLTSVYLACYHYSQVIRIVEGKNEYTKNRTKQNFGDNWQDSENIC